MNLKKALNIALIVTAMTVVSRVSAFAAPHFTLNPTSGNQTVGQNFTVVFGIDSDTDKVVGVDIEAKFDSSKLEVVSVEKGNVPSEETAYQFTYAPGQAIIHNDTGSFEVTLTPIGQSVLTGPVAKHELLKVTFKPKAVGNVTLNYACTAGSVVDTNIISPAGTDVVDCASNQSASYTIVAGTGGDPTAPVSTATPVPNVTTSLPQTGEVENTLILVCLGLSGIGAAMYFKFV